MFKKLVYLLLMLLIPLLPVNAQSTSPYTTEHHSWGSIYNIDSSSTVTFTVQNTWYQMVFDNNCCSNNTTTDQANDHIVILSDGYYQIALSATVVFSSGTESYEFFVKKNNGATSYDNLSFKMDVGKFNGGSTAVVSLVGMLPLEKNDTLEIWGRCTTAAGETALFETSTFTVCSL